MRAFVRLFGAVLCAVSLAGCLVETRNSIIENPLPIDPSIAGTWARTEDSAVWLLMIRPDEADPTLGKVAYVYVEPGDDDIDVGRMLFEVRLTEIGTATYFEAVPLGPEPFPDASQPVGRFVGRVSLVGPGTLRIEIPDAMLVKEAVEAGRLEGEIDESNLNRTVTLTSTTSRMRRFFATSAPADSDEIQLYRRVE